MTATVLIAEDDPTIINHIEDLCAEHGFAVDTANDFKTATERIETGHYAGLILETNLPLRPGGITRHRENGVHFIARLRKKTATAELPTLVYTDQDGGEATFHCGVLRIGGIDTTYVAQKNCGDPLGELMRGIEWMHRVMGDGKPPSEHQVPFIGASRNLHIHHDKIVLCGIEVWTDHAQDDVRDILVTLAQKNQRGTFPRIRGAVFNDILGRDSSNPISKPIQRFRDRCSELMRHKRQLVCEKFDVIGDPRGGGYHFHPCIQVHIHDELEPLLLEHEQSRSVNYDVVAAWVTDQLQDNTTLYPKMVIAHFVRERNPSTIKRYLKRMREDGLITSSATSGLQLGSAQGTIE